jgi:hypothetical protein
MRKHAQAMINYANNEDALVFVSLGVVAGVEYSVFVEHPLWNADKEYSVRTDMTEAEAVEDRAETLKLFNKAKANEKVQAEIVALDILTDELNSEIDAQRQELTSKLH